MATKKTVRSRKMTLDEFLRELYRTRDNEWVLEEGRIRARSRGGRHCPVTLVAARLAHTRFRAVKYVSAAEAIGLPTHLTCRIAEAADYNIDYGARGERTLRRKLLLAVGLPTDSGLKEVEA